MSKIPEMNLPPEATPWGRDMQNRILQMERMIDRLTNENLNVNKGQTGTIESLSRNIATIDNRIDDALATITLDMSDVPTGDLPQTRVTGDWDKGVNTASAITSTANITTTAVGKFDGGLESLDVYSHLVTGGGSYRATWTHQSGFLGYAPSSAQFKQDITSASVANIGDILERLRVVTFRYIDDVNNNGDEASVEWGLVAEEVHDLGLTWLVDYDEQGQPFGIKYERLALFLILAVQETR